MSSTKSPRAAEGGLSIHVRAISDAERVEAIRVTLQAPGAPIVLVLEQQGNGDWSQTVSNLPVGTYTAVAAAFAKAPDDPSFDEDEDLLFHSDPTAPFSITEGQTTPVFLFLRQDLREPPLDAPHFLSVVLASTPMVGVPVEITVLGGGGEGGLQLSGSGDGSFTNGSGDGASAAGATIEWTPDTLGQRRLMLHLEDAKGNQATVSLWVQVSDAAGAVDFEIHFNHSPWAELTTTLDNWEHKAQVRIELVLGDDVAGSVLYELDFAACDAAGLVFDPNLSPSPSASSPLGSVGFFLLEAADGQHRSCTIDIELSDQGTPPARQSQTLTLHTEFSASTCPPGLTDCFGFCVDLEENDDHCGACNDACGFDETCVDGSCESICGPGELYCDGTCADPFTDDANCNGCDNVCTGGRVCSGGACVCPGGTTDCSGQCIDTTNDDENCGACGNACGHDQYCSTSSCECIAPGLEACGAECVDLQSNVDSCGDCDTACSPGEVCIGGSCVDPSACNPSCTGHQLCVNGVCMPDPEYATWPVPPDNPTNYTWTDDTVLDNVTQLMWQRVATPTTTTQAGARAYCENLAQSGFAGFDDWRLPTRIELISIVNETRQHPAINVTAFPNTPYHPFTGDFVPGFWSASSHRQDVGWGWQVNYNLGYGQGVDAESPGYVRCVRFGEGHHTAASLPSPRYTDSGTSVRDNWTGVTWQKSTSGNSSEAYSAAVSRCTAASDWSRLPRRKELETILDVRRDHPAWDPAAFSGSYVADVWTSTRSRFSAVETFYWVLEFTYGGAGISEPVVWQAHHGRCVK